jgi:rubredoxin
MPYADDPDTRECPECEGDGFIEIMTNLTYDGDQTWKRIECPVCHGEKVIPIVEMEF